MQVQKFPGSVPFYNLKHYPSEVSSANNIKIQYSPEQQMERLTKKFIIVHPRWHCPSGNEITQVCNSQKCPSPDSFICRSSICEACTSSHPKEICGFSINLIYITKQLQSQAERRKRLIINSYKKQQEMISKIREGRDAEIERLCFNYLDKSHEDIVRKMYINREKPQINANEICKLVKNFKQLKQYTQNSREMEKYANTLDGLLKQMQYYKSNLLSQNKESKVINKKIKNPLKINKPPTKTPVKSIEKTAIKDILNESSQKKNIFDYIELEDDESERQEEQESLQISGSNAFIKNNQHFPHNLKGTQKWQFIQKMLFNPKKIQMIFHASWKTFDPIKFHESCDNNSHTLVLIKTKSSRIFGGYTPLSWNSHYDNKCLQYKKDPTHSSFIFSLDMMKQFELKPYSTAICCHKDWGPIFGNLNSKQTIIVNNSGIKCGICLECYNTDDHHMDDKQLLYKYTGQYSGNFFALQLAVFKIVWQ